MIKQNQIQQSTDVSEKQVLDLAAYAGEILLKNGAEIFRVEETMERIASSYGMKGKNSFVLSSGIFLAEETSNHTFYAYIKHIPLDSVHLERVAQVNQLSREIQEGHYSVEEARKKLSEIESLRDQNVLKYMIAYGIGSGSFCYLFGGTIRDSSIAIVCGIVLFWFLKLFELRKKKTSKILLNIVSATFVSSVSLFFYKLHIANDLNHLIIGSIIPLLPGVAFTNAIRDLANEDYISGTVRMVDAILVAVCIAIGVGIVFSVYRRCPGGIL